MATDKLGNVLRKYDAVFTGNRGRASVAFIIDDTPTPAGYLRAVRWEKRFQWFDDDGQQFRDWELVPTIIKDLGSSVKVHYDLLNADLREGLHAAVQVYGPFTSGLDSGYQPHAGLH